MASNALGVKSQRTHAAATLASRSGRMGAMIPDLATGMSPSASDVASVSFAEMNLGKRSMRRTSLFAMAGSQLPLLGHIFSCR